MYNKKIIFRHGLGFFNSFWSNLLPFFQGYQCFFVEENYFNNSSKTFSSYENKDFEVGIGHSLGFWKLCQTAPKAKYLIGINAFTNFLGEDSRLHSLRNIEYETFKAHFHKHPANTLKNFYTRCGFKNHNTDFSNINVPAIECDLNLLASPVELNNESKVLIINSLDDTVVPKNITDDNFTNTRTQIHYLEEGKHALGFQYAKEVSKIILDFIS